MDHWKKAPTENNRLYHHQQQQIQSNPPQASKVFQSKSSVVTATAAKVSSTLSGDNPSQQSLVDPVQSIANVLNHHHQSSKIAQHKRKSEKQAEKKESKNGKLLDYLNKDRQDNSASAGSKAATATTAKSVGAFAPENKLLSRDSGSSLSSVAPDCAHTSSNQVEQGNSYLYAYNDFVNPTRTETAKKPARTTRGKPKVARPAQPALDAPPAALSNSIGSIGDRLEQDASANNFQPAQATFLCNHKAGSSEATAKQQQRHSSHQQETLIDSDEDDAISYILHQHRAGGYKDLLLFPPDGALVPTGSQQDEHRNSYQLHVGSQNYYSHYPYDPNLVEEFESNSRINHHLLCSRSSHPRHICGIGGSHQNELNSIAARLKEESRRAFLLNQQPCKSDFTDINSHLTNSNRNFTSSKSVSGNHNQHSIADTTAIQSHQFTHELKIIQNQLSKGFLNQSSATTVADQCDISKLASSASSLLNSNQELHLNPSAIETGPTFSGHPAFRLAATASLVAEGGAAEPVLRGIGLVNDSSSNSSDQSRSTSLPQEAALVSSRRYRRRGSSAQRTQQRRSHQHQSRNQSNFLSWLLCCLCNIVSPASSSQQRLRIIEQDQQRRNPVQSPNVERNHKQGKRNLSKQQNPVLGMMFQSTSQQMGAGIGHLVGQSGAYYATQTPQGDINIHHQAYPNHAHHHHHHHSYPLPSDSSLSSSALASSAMRMSTFFRNCCSKKCLIVSCLTLIVFIFIFVIGLSAYLNFLINYNKVNFTPLSGRLKVDSQGDIFNEQLTNRTSKEFLSKQLQYETILRGAFDRTQNLLKSYPNHLVKCEVYSFRPGSLWIYFRLFINKKTLLQDVQLMRWKSPDEQIDKQFLPRLTQQTLHSGFEQLVQSSTNSTPNERRSRSSQTAELRSSAPSTSNRSSQDGNKSANLSHRDHVKSFDDQISRLMPIIEMVDLQSIQVTPEFDMLQTGELAPQQQQSMSDNLRASQLLTTATSAVVAATGSSKNLAEYDVAQPTTSDSSSSLVTPTSAPKSTNLPSSHLEIHSKSEDITVGPRKFTLQDYKENSTRPTTSSKPNLPSSNNQDSSAFLTNHQKKPNNIQVVKANLQNDTTGATRQSNTMKEIASTRSDFESQQNARPDKVVHLVLGQPIESQNGNIQRTNAPTRFPEDKPRASSPSRNITLFPALGKLDLPQGTPNSSSAGLTSADKVVANGTSFMQIVAPYQKIDFSSADSAANRKSTTESSIQQLWNAALGNNKPKNAVSTSSPGRNDATFAVVTDSSSQQKPKRLITIFTSGENNENEKVSNATSSFRSSGLDRISVLSADISDTIRAQMNATKPLQSQRSPTTTTPTLQIGTVSPSTVKPKVSPHLRHGGAIISTAQSARQDLPQSAILLSREIQHSSTTTTTAATSEGHLVATSDAGNVSNSSNSTVNQREQSNKPERQQQQQQQRKPSITSQRNSTDTLANPKNRTTKPGNKKVKKPANESHQNVGKNQTITTVNLRGGDNILASSSNHSSSRANGQGSPSVSVTQLRQSGKNSTHLHSGATQANGNDLLLVPTLPTTIELTRSTAALQPPVTPTMPLLASDSPSVLSNVQPDSGNNNFSADARTTSFATPTTESSLKFLPSSTADSSLTSTGSSNPRPGTTNFSNQWRPIQGGSLGESTSTPSVPNGQRRPSMSIIIGPERLPNPMNVPSTHSGSQSPFAMSAAVLENQLKPQAGSNVRLDSLSRISSPSVSVASGVPKRSSSSSSSRLTNSYHHAGSSSGNDFESHRVSRMRQGENHVMNVMGSPQVSSSSSTTISSLILDSNTRIVDDFMITTDRIEGNTRGSTLLPPLVLSSLQVPADGSSSRVKPVGELSSQPKRTRGPFAFETLKSSPLRSINSPSSIELLDVTSVRSGRSGRTGSDDQRILVRKKLFLGSGRDEADTESLLAPTNLSLETSNKNLVPGINSTTSASDRLVNSSNMFGNRKPALVVDEEHSSTGNETNEFPKLRCQYHGCKAKGSMRYSCLNYTQICDDFVDCHDESDELDCVSLLKHDGRSNELSFSNGAGIIYLNRRGSLAPMCVDNYLEPNLGVGMANSAQDLDLLQLDMTKKHQELIRQINTIGQYACSLQSFSKLVSVKINPHSMVDDSNRIRSSKLFHRLSIVGDSDRRDERSHLLVGSYQSGTSGHEVELSTLPNCPSERTVFVKCGGFECGQDSFSVIGSRNSIGHKGGLVMNDFPWLVKLHWQGALSCHGYLIDELWLISSSECFANKSLNADEVRHWSAEISYEHYGNDDYQSIESNRRNISEIFTTRSQEGTTNPESDVSIVLAKLEKPVRFSPLNRPICLPLFGTNKTSDFEMETLYRDCVTATLPLRGSALPAQDITLSKVKVHKSSECFAKDTNQRLDDLICVSDINETNSQMKDNDVTRVLICSSTNQVSSSRSRWTVVGVQNRLPGIGSGRKQAFKTISSQIGWIVDTMNPKPTYPILNSMRHGISVQPDGGGEPDLINFAVSRDQSCNQFKCSSGECISWSRICDGLFDCTSHDDERDCHK